MEIYSVHDKEFLEYGAVLEGFDTGALCALLKDIPTPASSTHYEPAHEPLESCEPVFSQLRDRVFGGSDMQLGYCGGYNKKLNCLEYHRGNEVLIGAYDYVLLLARRCDMENGALNTDKVKAFRAYAGLPVEIYASTLHYSPCHVDDATGFIVAVALPKGTNTKKPLFVPVSEEDRLMTACNKWLLAHEESPEAASGAKVCLFGENITLD